MGGCWRAMAASDLCAVVDIAAAVHAAYPESPEIFAERLDLFPAGCRIAVADGVTVGYAVMHPARLGRPPALDSLLGALPAGADVLYLHDVALLPRARGLGLGEAVTASAHALAAQGRLQRLALTATPEALSYWERRGFVRFDADKGLTATLASYGEEMVYMVASVRPGLLCHSVAAG